MTYHVELRSGGVGLPEREFIVSDVRVPCRCCGGPTDVVFQAALMPGLSAYWLITCLAPLETCALAGMTRSDRDYATFSLGEYKARALPGWRMPALPLPQPEVLRG
jgi:hypothetical protein